jgi:hypothetical protein
LFIGFWRPLQPWVSEDKGGEIDTQKGLKVEKLIRESLFKGGEIDTLTHSNQWRQLTSLHQWL